MRRGAAPGVGAAPSKTCPCGGSDWRAALAEEWAVGDFVVSACSPNTSSGARLWVAAAGEGGPPGSRLTPSGEQSTGLGFVGGTRPARLMRLSCAHCPAGRGSDPGLPGRGPHEPRTAPARTTVMQSAAAGLPPPLILPRKRDPGQPPGPTWYSSVA